MCFALSIPLIYFKLADEITRVYYDQCDVMNTYVKGKHHMIHLGCIQHSIQRGPIHLDHVLFLVQAGI